MKQCCIDCYWHSDVHNKNRCTNVNARSLLFNMVNGLPVLVYCRDIRQKQLPANSTYVYCKWYKESNTPVQMIDGKIDDDDDMPF